MYLYMTRCTCTCPVYLHLSGVPEPVRYLHPVRRTASAAGQSRRAGSCVLSPGHRMWPVTVPASGVQDGDGVGGGPAATRAPVTSGTASIRRRCGVGMASIRRRYCVDTACGCRDRISVWSGDHVPGSVVQWYGAVVRHGCAVWWYGVVWWYVWECGMLYLQWCVCRAGERCGGTAVRWYGWEA